MTWTDRDGAAVPVPDPPATGSHYDLIGAFQGATYARNAFAMGTTQETEVLMEVLDVSAGDRVLDVGCGNGRHVAALRERGVHAVGVDLSAAVLAGSDVAEGGLAAGLAQALPFADDVFDGVMSVCQGGFGLSAALDERALGSWHRVLRPGGRVALTAFSLVFASRYMQAGEAIDVAAGMHHHRADVRGPDGQRRSFDLWTAAYSVGHLRLLLQRSGFSVLDVAGVEAGHYRSDRPPTISDPELLIWAERF